MGTWNVLTLSDDDRLPVLSAELSRLGVEVAALSEVRRPGSGSISEGGYTFYWSGSPGGERCRGVAVAVSNRLAASIVRVAAVDERIMVARLRHTVGFLSLVAVYAPTEVKDLKELQWLTALGLCEVLEIESCWVLVPASGSASLVLDLQCGQCREGA